MLCPFCKDKEGNFKLFREGRYEGTLSCNVCDKEIGIVDINLEASVEED